MNRRFFRRPAALFARRFPCKIDAFRQDFGRRKNAMNRRIWLRNLLGAAAGALASGGPIAGAAARRKSVSYGLQLYTVRKQLARDFEGTLSRVAALGIKEVEFAGYFDRAPKDVGRMLRKFKLAAPSAHVDTATLRGDLPRAIEAARAIGHRYLVLGYLPENERKSLADYQTLVKLLDEAGRACRRAGLRLAYHNHDFEFQTIEGRTPYDLIVAETDAQNVKLELDLYWATKAGRDPAAYFERFPGRFPLVHVKDMDDTPRKGFTEVGRGTIDFKRVLAAARKAGVEHYFIEQDETPGEPTESVKISLEYLRALKF